MSKTIIVDCVVKRIAIAWIKKNYPDLPIVWHSLTPDGIVWLGNPKGMIEPYQRYPAALVISAGVLSSLLNEPGPRDKPPKYLDGIDRIFLEVPFYPAMALYNEDAEELGCRNGTELDAHYISLVAPWKGIFNKIVQLSEDELKALEQFARAACIVD